MTIKLNVLITRPTHKAQALSASLKKHKIACVIQPLFDYQPLADHQTCANLLVNTDILIFVSAAAVEFANATLAARHWCYHDIIAVGKATKTALQGVGINQVISPSQENSEGLLELAVLQNELHDKSITIVRGNGGREHLANHLIALGAKVNYLESYQRVWRTFPKDINKQWHDLQINCIVATSNAILEKLVQLTLSKPAQNNTQLVKNYWLNHCIWLVSSQRIGNKAKQLGLKNIVISDGANAQAITAALQQITTQ